MQTYKVVKSPNTELATTNKAIIHPMDTLATFEHVAVRYPKFNQAFVFSLKPDPSVPPHCLSFNNQARKWASLQTESQIEAAPYKFEGATQCLTSITFFIDFATRPNPRAGQEFDTDDMSREFSEQFVNQAFTVGQLVGFRYKQKYTFELTVKSLEAVKLVNAGPESSVEIGLTTGNTIMMFERAEGSEVKLIGKLTSSVSAPRIFSHDWDFASMGIGGLGEQFNKIFRRAFASRLLPPHIAQSMGEEHVRGILLYGPPGTGKTLIARQIGKMLLAREPKIVNGPEVLNKYVGESEANIRKLFQDAEEEQAKSGINSGLHMIIFDEIDALCKSRGNSASSAGVGDNVVNQLLSKIDGVNSLLNVLLVGMTNRKDLIDEALLRPGRLEVQIEIGLPNKEGRVEILNIHTKNLRENGWMDPSVDLIELAEASKNFTGAEIAGLVKAARSLAVSRILKPDSKNEIDQESLKKIKVTKADFFSALEHDVKAALGASEDQLKELALPIIEWDQIINGIKLKQRAIIDHISSPDVDAKRPFYVLLVGEPGSGLTTLAANMAEQTEFPFIRVYEARTTGDMTENSKVQYMKKLFDDAARSELSCIVFDDIDAIMDYSHIGPRYSNASRTVFSKNKNLILPKGHRMLVICTCSYPPFLDDLKLSKVFHYVIRVPSLVNSKQVKVAVEQMIKTDKVEYTVQQCDELTRQLELIPFKMGIKELEHLIKHPPTDDPNKRVETFISEMHSLKLIIERY